MGTGTLIFLAVKEEARPLRRVLRGRAGVRLCVTGIGQRHAREAVERELGRVRPGLVLTCGFAGGLNPTLGRGVVVFQADEEAAVGKDLESAGAVSGRFHCADRILVTPREKAEARRETGADAVEMESAVIRQHCRACGVPSATIRVISDAAAEALPLDFNRLSTADWELRYGRLLMTLGRSPGKIGGLLRFRRELAHAADCLAQVVAALIERRAARFGDARGAAVSD